MDSKHIRELESYFNAMECPDCGGLHQCHLCVDDNNSIAVVFDESGLFKPCYGYKEKVFKSIKEQNNIYTVIL